ncbi:MAG: hypothetical protein IJ191_03370 [Treponema sp.]|nr:hypothetical protein [Treponema sp.]
MRTYGDRRQTAFALCLCAVFVCCRSVPVPERSAVHPFDLLDDGGSFYLSLSPETDADLTERIVATYFSGARKSAVSRVARVYAGFYHSRSSRTLQVAASGALPTRMLSVLFPKRAGWKPQVLTVSAPETTATERTYRYYARDDIQISIPSDTIACISPDVTRMLRRYDSISHGGVSDGPQLSADVRDWLCDETNEIRFYAGSPLSFLTMLTGAHLNVRLAYVKGTMVVDAAVPDSYRVTLEFEFKDPRMLTVGQALLTLAFGLSDGSAVRNSPTNMVISEINVKKEQLYRLFLL